MLRAARPCMPLGHARRRHPNGHLSKRRGCCSDGPCRRDTCLIRVLAALPSPAVLSFKVVAICFYGGRSQCGAVELVLRLQANKTNRKHVAQALARQLVFVLFLFGPRLWRAVRRRRACGVVFPQAPVGMSCLRSAKPPLVFCSSPL